MRTTSPAPFRQAIDQMLRAQDPYPAYVINRWWEVVAANAAGRTPLPRGRCWRCKCHRHVSGPWPDSGSDRELVSGGVDRSPPAPTRGGAGRPGRPSEHAAEAVNDIEDTKGEVIRVAPRSIVVAAECSREREIRGSCRSTEVPLVVSGAS